MSNHRAIRRHGDLAINERDPASIAADVSERRIDTEVPVDKKQNVERRSFEHALHVSRRLVSRLRDQMS
jgi:hypothetical protein